MEQLNFQPNPRILIKKDNDKVVRVCFKGFTHSNYDHNGIHDFLPEHNITDIGKFKMNVVFVECDVSTRFAEGLRLLHNGRSAMKFCEIVGHLTISNCTAVERDVLDALPFKWSRLTISASSDDSTTVALSHDFLTLSNMKKRNCFEFLTISGNQFEMTENLGIAVNSVVESCSIKHLSFQNCVLPGEFLAHLQNTVAEKNLTLLDFSGSQLDIFSCNHLTRFLGILGKDTPEQLCLHSTNINDQLLDILTGSLVSNSNLKQLCCGVVQSVSSTAWTRFFEKFAEVGASSNLEVLDLDYQHCSQLHNAEVHLHNDFNDEVAFSIAKAVGTLEKLHTIRLGSCVKITQRGWDSIFREISKKTKWKLLNVGGAHFNLSANVVKQLIDNDVEVYDMVFNPLEKSGWLGVFTLLKENACVRRMWFRVTAFIDDDNIEKLVNAAQSNKHLKRLDFHGLVQVRHMILMKPLFGKQKQSVTVTMNLLDSDGKTKRVRMRTGEKKLD